MRKNLCKIETNLSKTTLPDPGTTIACDPETRVVLSCKGLRILVYDRLHDETATASLDRTVLPSRKFQLLDQRIQGLFHYPHVAIGLPVSISLLLRIPLGKGLIRTVLAKRFAAGTAVAIAGRSTPSSSHVSR